MKVEVDEAGDVVVRLSRAEANILRWAGRSPAVAQAADEVQDEVRRLVKQAMDSREAADMGDITINPGLGGGGFCDKTTFGPPDERGLVFCCRHRPGHSGECEPALTVKVPAKCACGEVSP